MSTAAHELDLAPLIADTEEEILRLVSDRDPSTVGVYEQCRYHLGLDGTNGVSGKRMRPLLGLLAYASITGDHQAALPGAAAVELGHNFRPVPGPPPPPPPPPATPKPPPRGRPPSSSATTSASSTTTSRMATASGAIGR